MRKEFLLALFAAMLLSSSIFAQDVDQDFDEEENIPVEFSIIPRLDFSPAFSLDKTEPHEFELNPTLTTLLEGQPCDWFSYSMCNSWLAGNALSWPDVLSGYYKREEGGANLFFSDSDGANWLSWANVTFTVGGNWGSLDFTLGKDAILTGGFEIDQYDFDAHYQLCSYFWNNYNVYQWGAKVAYTLPNETSSFAFQWGTSPLGVKMFSDKTFAYSLQWRGDYDWYSSIWSTNFFADSENEVYQPDGTNKAGYMNIVSLGNEFYVGDVTLGLEWMNRAWTASNFFGQEGHIIAGATYNWNDKIEVTARGGWDYMYRDCIYAENGTRTGGEDYWFAGAVLNWYPLKNRDLRVHALTAYNNNQWDGYMCAEVGVTYNFNLTQLIRNKR